MLIRVSLNGSPKLEENESALFPGRNELGHTSYLIFKYKAKIGKISETSDPLNTEEKQNLPCNAVTNDSI